MGNLARAPGSYRGKPASKDLNMNSRHNAFCLLNRLSAAALVLACMGPALAQAKGSSHPPQTAGTSVAAAPCWYQIPGRFQLVNLNQIAAVSVYEESKTTRRIEWQTTAYHPVLVSRVVPVDQVQAMLDAIRAASSECR